MIVDPDLHRIQTDDATPAEARAAIRKVIARDGAEAAGAVYTALRGWTWQILEGRRFDDALVEWHRVMMATAAALSERDPKTARYVEALAHLVDDTIRYGASHDLRQLLSRSHLADLLDFVRRHNGRLERARLEELSGLKPSRLSQLLTELVVAGALEREANGRNALFALTDIGRTLLERRADHRREKAMAAADADEPPVRAAPPLLTLAFDDSETDVDPKPAKTISMTFGDSNSGSEARQSDVSYQFGAGERRSRVGALDVMRARLAISGSDAGKTFDLV